MSIANLYEFQILKQLEMLSRYNWKFQLHLSLLWVSSLSVSTIRLSLFTLSHLFCVYLTHSFSVCALALRISILLSLSALTIFPVCVLHLDHTPFESFPQSFSHHLTCSLVLPSHPAYSIELYTQLALNNSVLSNADKGEFTFYKNDHQFRVLRSKEDHELSGQVVHLTELVLV